MKKIILLFIFVFMLFIPCYGVKATTLQDLYNDVNALEKSYNAAKASNPTGPPLNLSIIAINKL